MGPQLNLQYIFIITNIYVYFFKFEQLIKDDELRAKQHRTILSLRERSLTNRLKWEVTMYDLQVK